MRDGRRRDGVLGQREQSRQYSSHKEDPCTFTATCQCIPSKVPQHEWWVPEKSHVEIEPQQPRAQRSNVEDHGHVALHGTPEQDESWLDGPSDQWDGAAEGLGMGEDENGRW